MFRPGEASLTLGSNQRNPLADIKLLAPLGAFYTETSFILDKGAVIYDYLKGNQALNNESK